VDLAEAVVEAEIFPGVFPSLRGISWSCRASLRISAADVDAWILCTDSDEYVQKNVATLIREVCKHSPELAQLVVNAGGAIFCYLLSL
jgi:hypothetical protein